MDFDFDAMAASSSSTSSTSSIPFEWLPVEELHRGQLWYDDGNMIVQAGFTQFCVHDEILALSSPVLMDLIATVKSVEWGDELPVLFMEEEPHEVLLLLQAMYLTEPQCLFDTVTIRTLNELGNKYNAPDVIYIAEQSIAQLSSLANVLSDFMASTSPTTPGTEEQDKDENSRYPAPEPRDELEATETRLLDLTSSPLGMEALKMVGETLKKMAEEEGGESSYPGEVLKLQPPTISLFSLA